MKGSPPSEPDTRHPTPDTWLGEFITHSPEETLALAKRIGEQLRGGEIFLLRGDLGAGKTLFAKGLAAGLRIDPGDVTSPSFTLINVHEGRLRFYHIDLYRLEPGAHQSLGLEEIFEDEKAATAVEWAERLQYAPAASMWVNIDYLDHNERKINIGR